MCGWVKWDGKKRQVNVEPSNTLPWFAMGSPVGQKVVLLNKWREEVRNLGPISAGKIQEGSCLLPVMG